MRALLLLIPLLLTACGAELPPLPAWQSPEQRQHPDLGKILDIRHNKSLTPEQLLSQLKPARWVLIGEQHDNPDHHALQEWLLRHLPLARPQGSVLLEMLSPDQQSRVRQVQLAFAKNNPPDNLRLALKWQKGWDWTQYGPLMHYLLQQSYPLLPANLTATEVSALYQTPPKLAEGQATQVAVQEGLRQKIREGHCNLLPESQVPAMLAVQQQRDRRMAEALTAAPQPAVLLAGANHVRRDLGVPLHMADMKHSEGLLVLILAEAGTSVSAAEADFVWFTPAVPAQDQCAALRQRFNKPKS